jgi:hypothetical protein
MSRIPVRECSALLLDHGEIGVEIRLSHQVQSAKSTSYRPTRKVGSVLLTALGALRA